MSFALNSGCLLPWNPDCCHCCWGLRSEAVLAGVITVTKDWHGFYGWKYENEAWSCEDYSDFYRLSFQTFKKLVSKKTPYCWSKIPKTSDESSVTTYSKKYSKVKTQAKSPCQIQFFSKTASSSRVDWWNRDHILAVVAAAASPHYQESNQWLPLPHTQKAPALHWKKGTQFQTFPGCQDVSYPRGTKSSWTSTRSSWATAARWT